MKLTKPQRELLGLICAPTVMCGVTVSQSYKPAQKLVELGLAEMRITRMGNPLLTPTDAGRRLNGEAK